MNTQVVHFHNQKNQRLWLQIGPIILVLVIFIAGAIGYDCLKYYYIKQNQDTIDFVNQIVSSIINQTDFYKKHSTAFALDLIESNLNKISSDYEIKTLDYDSSYFEYHIMFNKKDIFYIGVEKYGRDDLRVGDFHLVKTNKFSEPNKIGINKGTRYEWRFLKAIK